MKIKIGNKVYDVEVLELGEDKIKITVDGKEFFFGKAIGEKEKISIAKTSLPKRSFLRKEIKAPIVGIISELLVKEGEFVRKDQKVLTISAMKMENEIISDFEGKVKEILVKKNQEVKEGDILIVLQ